MQTIEQALEKLSHSKFRSSFYLTRAERKYIEDKGMNVIRSHAADFVNVKIVPEEIYDLLKIDGILPAYHMNKKHWISILLDGSVSVTAIKKLVDTSFSLTKKKIAKNTKN